MTTLTPPRRDDATPPARPPAPTDGPGGPDDGITLAQVLAAVRGLPSALLGAATAWVAVLSWRGMVEASHRFLIPLLLMSLLLAGIGWWVRRRTDRAALAFLTQVVVLAVWLVHHVTGSWLPTPGAVVDVWDELVTGALAGQRYVSPVSTQHPEFATVLLLSGLGIALAVDLIAHGLRHAALAGLPLLLAVTIAASVLLSPVNWLIFVVVALAWLTLVALQESNRLGSWEGTSDGGSLATLSAMGGLAARIALVCVLVAALLTAGLTSQGRQLGNFAGSNGNGTLTTSNPMLDMRRNLRETRNVPLVSVTARTAPSYLRLTVLDDFSGDAWRPSDRTFDNTSVVSTSLPPPAGLNPLNQGSASTWRVQVARSFPSRWLPVPFVTSLLDVKGQWRYSPDTLDVISGTDDTAAGLSYTLSTYQPEVDPAQLRTAAAPPAPLERRMTDLPTDLPVTFRRVAQQVTAGATNDYERAVALQDWFRDKGGFTYSLTPSSGTGTAQLERFITTDKVGYCEQFSTAMAVMARTLGIPARVSVGFLRPQKTGPSSYTFGSRSLHAWPELYFTGVGWIRFEPTPADRTGNPPAYTAPQAAAPTSAAPSTTVNPTARPSQAKPSIAPNNADATGNTDRSFPWRLVIVALVLVALLLLALTPAFVRRRSTRRRWAGAGSPEALADAAWSEVRATAIDLDLGWSDQDTVRTNGDRVQRAVTPTLEARDALRDVVGFVELTRYARPRELSADTAARVQTDVRTWAEEMHRSVDPRRSRRATWWPRSVLRWRDRRR